MRSLKLVVCLLSVHDPNEIGNCDLKLAVVGIDPKFDHKFPDKSSFSCLFENQSNMPCDLILPHHTFLFSPLRFLVWHIFDLHVGIRQKINANYMDFNFTMDMHGRTMKTWCYWCQGLHPSWTFACLFIKLSVQSTYHISSCYNLDLIHSYLLSIVIGMLVVCFMWKVHYLNGRLVIWFNDCIELHYEILLSGNLGKWSWGLTIVICCMGFFNGADEAFLGCFGEFWYCYWKA